MTPQLSARSLSCKIDSNQPRLRIWKGKVPMAWNLKEVTPTHNLKTFTSPKDLLLWLATIYWPSSNLHEVTLAD